MTRYARPRSLDEALALLARESWRILAGGTDFYPAQGTRPLSENVLDIGAVGELRGIRETAGEYLIGARTTWSDIVRADLPAAFDALKLAAREVGSIQIQNTGTVAGNLCNASPAADGVPPLLVVDAQVELRSVGASRRLPLSDFILGNRKTARAADEMVTAIIVPKRAAGGVSGFVKLGARRYLVISIAMGAVRAEVGAGGTIRTMAVAVGSCSAVARRLSSLERGLVGRSIADVRDALAEDALAELAPIDDVRATASYRLEAAREIVSRAVAQLPDAAMNQGRAA